MSSMETQSLSVVLGKLSNLLIRESDFLLGVEPYIQTIDELLRRKFSEEHTDSTKLKNLIDNIEDAVADLMVISDNRWKKYGFLWYYMSFGGQPQGLFFVMLVMQLIDYYKLVEKLPHIYDQIWSTLVFYSHDFSGLFELSYSCLSVRNTVMFGAITQCEASAAEQLVSPSVRREALCLCHKLGSFQDFLKDVEIEKLRKEEMAWIDEIFYVCCSANNIVNSFLCSLQHRQSNGIWPFKNLIQIIPILNSQKKLLALLSEIKDRIYDIDQRKPRLVLTPVSLSNNVRSLMLACDADQLDRISFDEDIDAITTKLLVQDTRCITISILGVGGIGKTSLAELVYTNRAIVHHFPLRLWVSGTNETETWKSFWELEVVLITIKLSKWLILCLLMNGSS